MWPMSVLSLAGASSWVTSIFSIAAAPSSFRRSSLLAAAPTVQPSFISSLATSLPIPEEAPMTIAFFIIPY